MFEKNLLKSRACFTAILVFRLEGGDFLGNICAFCSLESHKGQFSPQQKYSQFMLCLLVWNRRSLGIHSGHTPKYTICHGLQVGVMFSSRAALYLNSSCPNMFSTRGLTAAARHEAACHARSWAVRSRGSLRVQGADQGQKWAEPRCGLGQETQRLVWEQGLSQAAGGAGSKWAGSSSQEMEHKTGSRDKPR